MSLNIEKVERLIAHLQRDDVVLGLGRYFDPSTGLSCALGEAANIEGLPRNEAQFYDVRVDGSYGFTRAQHTAIVNANDDTDDPIERKRAVIALLRKFIDDARKESA